MNIVKQPKEKMQRVEISLPASAIKEFDDLAKINMRSRKNMIENILTVYAKNFRMNIATSSQATK